MRHEKRNGSTVTSIIAALIFVLILTLFGRSVQGSKNQYPSQNRVTVITEQSSVIGSDYSRIHVLDEAKYHFMPPLADME